LTELFDPLRALRVLDEHRVRFVVIGGFAADLLGAPLNTNDLDVCYDTSPENTLRMAAALNELGAERRTDRVDTGTPFVLDGPTLAAGHSFTFDTLAGSVDVVATPRGTAGFPDLATKAVAVSVGDFDIPLVALADLMRMKRASYRIKDKMQLEVLAVLQEMIEEAEQDTPT
jgi:hypothetical protein